MTGLHPLMYGAGRADTGASSCPQICERIRTAFDLEGEISPVTNNLWLISAWAHPALVLLASL